MPIGHELSTLRARKLFTWVFTMLHLRHRWDVHLDGEVKQAGLKFSERWDLEMIIKYFKEKTGEKKRVWWRINPCGTLLLRECNKSKKQRKRGRAKSPGSKALRTTGWPINYDSWGRIRMEERLCNDPFVIYRPGVWFEGLLLIASISAFWNLGIIRGFYFYLHCIFSRISVSQK